MFNSLIAYKYDKSKTDFSNISKQINNKKYLFKPTEDYETHSSGFSSFFDDTFIIESDNRILLKACFSTKKVSKRTVLLLLQKRIEQIKNENPENEISDAIRNIYYEQIQRECLKYTEPVTKTVFLLIDKYTNYIYVDASSSSIAENTLHLLRKMIGLLACRQLESDNASSRLSLFLTVDYLENISESVYIPEYPIVAAKDSENTISVKLEGLSRASREFLNVLEPLFINSIDMKLIDTDTSDKLATFILSISKRNILTLKKFRYDEYENNSETTDNISYYYTSKMLLIGRYMSLIINSFVEFFNLETE